MDDEPTWPPGRRSPQARPRCSPGPSMIVKVKEPQADERRLLRPGQTLFTYLHLAPDPEQARDLIASGAAASPTRP